MKILSRLAVAYEYYIQDNKVRQQNDRLLAAASVRPFYANSSILTLLFLHLLKTSFITYNPVKSNIMNSEPKSLKKTQETL